MYHYICSTYVRTYMHVHTFMYSSLEQHQTQNLYKHQAQLFTALLQESSQLTFDLLLRLPSLCTWRGVEGREVSVPFVSREKAFNIQHVHIFGLVKSVRFVTSHRELEHEEMLTTTSIVRKHVCTYAVQSTKSTKQHLQIFFFTDFS